MKRNMINLAMAFLFGTSLAVTGQGALAAETFPDRPIRLVIPFPPGGAGDIIGRILSPKLSDELGKPILVDNRGGGNQLIASQFVAKSAPDGYNLLLASATHAINPALVKNLPYDTIKDFSTISLVAEAPTIIVAHPNLGVRTIQELIAMAKSKPGAINFASSGMGTAGHLGIEMLKSMAGIDLVHVPYKGAGQAMTDVISGKVPVICTSLLAAMPQVRAGAVRALGITGATRTNVAQGVPTVAEQGLPGFYSTSWYAVVGPANLSRAVVDRLYTATLRTVKSPDISSQLLNMGAAQPAGLNPEETLKFVQAEIARWSEVIKKAGIKAEE